MVDGEPMPADDEIQTIYRQVDEFNDELRASGGWVFAGGLHPRDQRHGRAGPRG